MTTKPTTPKIPERPRGAMFRLPDAVVVDIGKQAQKLNLPPATVREYVNDWLAAQLAATSVHDIVAAKFAGYFGNLQKALGGDK